MDVHIVKMTGSELRKLWKTSGISVLEMAKMLNISRSTLYNVFDQETVPEDIEARVDASPDLSKWKNIILSKEETAPAVNKSDDGSLIVMLKETLSMLNTAIDRLEKSSNRLEKNNDFIMKDATIFRDIVESGVKQGAIKFTTPAKR